MSGIEVHDPGDLRKYRTEIPNLVFEMGLSRTRSPSTGT